MTPQRTSSPRMLADKAREVVAKVRPGAGVGRRSLPIRRPADVIRGLWEDPAELAKVLVGIPVAEAFLEIGPEVRDWGTTATVTLKLESAVPGMATQTLAGKAVRRLKALAETGEVPTTEDNPSGREAQS
jgi:hypothetical protein